MAVVLAQMVKRWSTIAMSIEFSARDRRLGWQKIAKLKVCTQLNLCLGISGRLTSPFVPEIRLDLLEKEFDNSYMDLEKVARSFSDDYDFVETSEALRKLLSNLGQCFVQLVHKSQTIFQVL